MHRQITRKQVEWERASCRGVDTNTWYLARTDLFDQEQITYNHLRRICFSCPIQKECLQIGTSLERYGFWGGLDEAERTHIYEGRNSMIIVRLIRDLELLGMMQYKELKAIVLSVKRVFGEFDFTERMYVERPTKSR